MTAANIWLNLAASGRATKSLDADWSHLRDVGPENPQFSRATPSWMMMPFGSPGRRRNSQASAIDTTSRRSWTLQA